MTNKSITILVFMSFLSLTTLTVSCRQHRTPKSITFKRIEQTDNSQSDKNQKKETSRDCQHLTDSLSNICIPTRISDKPEQIIFRRAYVVSYNKNTKIPNWVAWQLIAKHTDGPYKRMNNFHEEEEVLEPRATLDDYRRSGWSRGHMCPAGDNKWNENAMYESFSLVNVCPQDASLNSGLWNSIEMDCRKWARKYGDIYIACGPVLLNREYETIGINKVVVPEAFFKVILRLKPEPSAIGFIVRNNEGKKKKDQFVNTVDDVERITGMDFFPALPDDIENVVESTANLKDW